MIKVHLPVEQLKTVPLAAVATEEWGNILQEQVGILKARDQFINVRINVSVITRISYLCKVKAESK